MCHKSHWILNLISLFVWAVSVPSNAQDYSVFDTLSAIQALEFTRQGQTAGSLTFRFQDSRGFIWGADEFYRPMRFDGKQIEVFEHDPEDSTSVSQGKLWDIKFSFLEDHKGRIWIAYATGGGHVDCFDPATSRFQRFGPRLEEACGSTLAENARALFEDHLGNIWMAADRNLFKYDPINDVVYCFKMPHWVSTIFEDDQHNLWVHFVHHNLTRINRNSGIIEEEIEYPVGYQPSMDQNWDPRNNDYHHQMSGTNAHLLVVRGRFYEFDADQCSITALQKTPLTDESLIYSFFAKDDLILIATYSGLLLQYHLDRKSFSSSPIFQLPEKGEFQEYSLPYHLLQTTGGIIWANVYQSGKKQLKNIQLFPSRLAVSKIPIPNDLEKVNFNIALGEYCLLFNNKPYFFTHPWLTPIFPEAIDSNKISLSIPNVKDTWKWTYHFETASDGHLWQVASPIYSSPKLIIREYNKAGKLLSQYTRNEDEHKGYPGGLLKDIAFDQNGKLWISTRYGGVCQFDPDDGSFTNFSSGLGEKKPVINYILVDQKNSVWVGGGFGLKRLNQENGVWTDMLQERSSINIRTRGIYEDLKGNIWTCTNDRVFQISQQLKVKSYGAQKGFSGMGYYFFEDFYQQLWLTSDSKVFLYDEDKDRFIAFGPEEGVSSAQFFGKPYLFEQDSSIIIAGRLNDVYTFRPDKMNVEERLPVLYFTELQLFNEKVETTADGILQHALDYSDQIKLRYEQNDFTVHYTVPEYAHADELEFIVRMLGFNDNWQNLGDKREVRYTNLAPGEYTLQVKVRNHLGLESKAPRNLIISILPPWYRTWWAYGLWLGLFLGMIFWLYSFQLNRKLAEAEASRLKELDQAKSQLYTNITHEFRTPLTIILGMADQMKSDPKNWFNEGVQLIRRNGKQLLNLVNQMLDLSKLESGQMSLNLIQSDIVGFIQYLTESFHSYADSKDIRLHFSSDFSELIMDYDPEKIQHIFANLLSNAIKFTPAGGNVYIQLMTGQSELKVLDRKFKIKRQDIIYSEQDLLLVVKDNGLGIPSEHLPYIFDRFYQVDGSITRRDEGTGIGLALTRELVKMMQGEIMVESEVNRGENSSGTKFTILLPISRKANVIKTPDTDHSLMGKSLDADLSEMSMSQIVEVPQSDRPLVLLIEDNPDVITYLGSFLLRDYKLETATNGQEGINKALAQTPDLIISDVMMPEKDGFEVCEMLKKDERTSHIPIILLTAKSDSGARLEGLTYGADAYLAKPFDKEELLVRMEKLIELRLRLQLHYEKSSDLLKISKKVVLTQEELFLQKLISIVEENLSEEHFGLSDLCRKAHLSRSQLFRKLKALTGQSTTKFIRSIRLAKGKELLETTNKTVSEVAYAVGFSNLSYFSTMFKETYGISPREVKNSP